VFGSGPFDIVFVPGFVWNVERQWWLEPVARGLRRIGSFARVVVFDRRGTGLSDRIDEANPPTLEASQARDPKLRRGFASFMRLSSSPGAAVYFESVYRDTDIRNTLGTIQVPVLVTHRTGDLIEPVESSRHLAANIATARLLELSGADHYLFADDQAQLVDAIERFLVSVQHEEVDVDRVLATVLFTDLVGSTETVARIGDGAWRELVAAHDQRVRALLGRYRGREVDHAGDGFFAIFDGPARAVRCALAIEDAMHALGAEVRAGVHTGEVELDGADVRGIAVNIGARIAASAGPQEVLVSSTVKDLVAGSGLGFEPRGQHTLKGISDEWHLFVAVPRATEPLLT
jgi:class 3 adenylate cyclase